MILFKDISKKIFDKLFLTDLKNYVEIKNVFISQNKENENDIKIFFEIKYKDNFHLFYEKFNPNDFNIDIIIFLFIKQTNRILGLNVNCDCPKEIIFFSE